MGPQQFLDTICPLQWEIYNTTQRHLTLYQFLGAKPNATDEELHKIYQAHAQKLGVEIDPCLAKLFKDSGEPVGDQVPKACNSDASAKAEEKIRLVTEATLILLDPVIKDQYTIYFMTLMYQIHIAEDQIDYKSPLGKWMKQAKAVGKLQGGVDHAFKQLCGKYMNE